MIAAQHISYWKLEALRLIDNKSFIVYKRFWFNAILYRQILSSWRLGTHCNFSVATEDDGSHTNDSSPAGIDLLTNLAHASFVSVMTFRAQSYSTRKFINIGILARRDLQAFTKYVWMEHIAEQYDMHKFKDIKVK